ncbi:MAG: Rrf2 family transcriptional regulator [Pirellulales bacterium]
MQLSRSVSYAVGILLRLAAEGGGPLTAARIARGCRFPPRFLYRVLRRMVDAGLLRGVSGPGGGYALARKPRAISLLDVVVAVDGDVRAVPLPPVTPRHRRAMQEINALQERQTEALRKELSRLNLARLCRLK